MQTGLTEAASRGAANEGSLGYNVLKFGCCGFLSEDHDAKEIQPDKERGGSHSLSYVELRGKNTEGELKFRE